MSPNFPSSDDEPFSSLLKNDDNELRVCKNDATDAAHHALATFKARKIRRRKIVATSIPVVALTLLASVAMIFKSANQSDKNVVPTQIAQQTDSPETLDPKFAAQLAELQEKINELQAQVAEQKRLFEEHEQKTALKIQLASNVVKTQAEKIADLNRELDRRFELEKNASTFLNFARKYAAENKKELAIAEYNVVLRSFSESETAKLAREELSKLNRL